MCFRRATPVALPRRIPKNAFQTCNAVAAALADGGDRTHTLLPVLDFESSASANSATSAFCEEATTNPFAMKRKRQRRQPQLLSRRTSREGRSQELQEFRSCRMRRLFGL